MRSTEPDFSSSSKVSLKEPWAIPFVAAASACLLLLSSIGVPRDTLLGEAVSVGVWGNDVDNAQQEVFNYLTIDQSRQRSWVDPYIQTSQKFASHFGILIAVDGVEQTSTGIDNWPMQLVSESEWSNFTTADVEIRF